MKTAFDLTETEFTALRIPYGATGKFTSINGKYQIEILSAKPIDAKQWAHSFPVKVNGKRMNVPFGHIRKLQFELPLEYGYHVTYGFIQLFKSDGYKTLN